MIKMFSREKSKLKDVEFKGKFLIIKHTSSTTNWMKV